jgi:hypothetical protein
MEPRKEEEEEEEGLVKRTNYEVRHYQIISNQFESIY